MISLFLKIHINTFFEMMFSMFYGKTESMPSMTRMYCALIKCHVFWFISHALINDGRHDFIVSVYRCNKGQFLVGTVFISIYILFKSHFVFTLDTVQQTVTMHSLLCMNRYLSLQHVPGPYMCLFNRNLYFLQLENSHEDETVIVIVL